MNFLKHYFYANHGFIVYKKMKDDRKNTGIIQISFITLIFPNTIVIISTISLSPIDSQFRAKYFYSIK